MLIFPLIQSTGGGPVTVSYTDDDKSTASQSSYTFSNKAIGTAGNNRQVVVAVMDQGGASRTVDCTSVTIGGQSATSLVELQSADQTFCELWVASVSTGTTGDVVVNFAANADKCQIIVWALYDADTTVHATSSDSSTGTDAASTTIDVPANGAVIAASCVRGSSASTSTWAGVTEDFDEVWVSAISATGGSEAYEAEQSGLTVSVTPSISINNQSMVVASWGPA